MQAAASQGDVAATDSGRVEVVSPNSPRFLDRLREVLRSRHYSHRTDKTYCHWGKRFICLHKIRHPAEMGKPESNAFLTHLAVKTTMIYTHVLNRGVKSPANDLKEESPVYYTESMYYPILSDAGALSACNHKAYGVLNTGALCRDFAAHSCYEETI